MPLPGWRLRDHRPGYGPLPDQQDPSPFDDTDAEAAEFILQENTPHLGSR